MHAVLLLLPSLWVYMCLAQCIKISLFSRYSPSTLVLTLFLCHLPWSSLTSGGEREFNGDIPIIALSSEVSFYIMASCGYVFVPSASEGASTMMTEQSTNLWVQQHVFMNHFIFTQKKKNSRICFYTIYLGYPVSVPWSIKQFEEWGSSGVGPKSNQILAGCSHSSGLPLS